MKKIGILTFHRALNYGAVLQTFALEKKINEIGKEQVCAEIVDYRNAYIEKGRSVSERITPFSVGKLLSAGLLIYKRAIFNSFIKKHVRCSQQSFRRADISEANNSYEAFIVGSDQVWNYQLTAKDHSYLLDFAKENVKRFSYAASMGIKKLDDNIIQEYVQQLGGFKQISVRENETSSYLSQVLENKKILTHIDPTLLLTQTEWNVIASNGKAKEKYILVYNVPKPDQLFELAEQLSIDTGLRIKYITNNQRPKRHAKDLVYPSVEEFIRLFSDASYVITNSFHGTVFSIIFHCPMLVELKEGSTSHDRINTLLGECGLLNRISGEMGYEAIFEEINWGHVDSQINKLRVSAFEYLKEIIDEI